MWEILQRLQREGHFAMIERVRGRTLCGFVGAASDELALINTVTPSCDFDGGIVVRTDDVECVRWGTKILKARARATQDSPSAPESLTMAELSSWSVLLDRLSLDEPVLTMHRESDNDWHVITEFTATSERVEGCELATDGSRDGEIAFKLGDLTRVDFGGAYERGLARLHRMQLTAES